MLDLFQSTRLFISTYNATTFLESLFYNIPTIIFWDPSLWELRPSAEPYMNALARVGIFHSNPESAARMMIEIWHDVESWWFSRQIQEARLFFMANYSRDNPDIPFLLKSVFSD